jgi:microsomal dipeptidase-like Zn-dependent dipeptidase
VLVDLHAHYPMHLMPSEQDSAHERLKRWKKERFRAMVVSLISRFANYEGPGDTPSVTDELMAEGDVGVALSVLYQPFDEVDFSKDYGAPPAPSYFEDILDQMSMVEDHAGRTHGAVTVAHDGAELRAALDGGQRALVHCIEGGFHVGASKAEVAANVRTLKQHGVAYITVAHLFWRGVATNAPAIPFLPDRLYRMLFPQPRGEGLSPLGTALVEAMVAERVLIDITHMSDTGVDELFALLDRIDPDRAVPVVSTHGGCRLGSEEYCHSDDTLKRIAARDGFVGFLLCDHHLCDGVRRRQTKTFEDSLEVLCAHIDHLHEATGSMRYAAIGSDLDGYIKPALAGLEHMGRMTKLQAALSDRYGEDDAALICHGNALRVLESYWGAGA